MGATAVAGGEMAYGAWIDGLWASDLVEISDNPADLDKPGWWAVVGEFEGRWHLGRFAHVEPAPIPEAPWIGTGAWSSSIDRAGYLRDVEVLREAIARGEIYQANLCRVLSAECSGSLQGLASYLHSAHPAPFGAWINLPEIEVVCASPERFLERDGSQILSSPIKGTGRTFADLSEKDRAENVMIVDLVRHDLAQVTEAGSVRTPRLLDVEEHPGLVHLVSDVAGTLRPDVSWSQILDSTFPPGSVTGAPKLSALEWIQRLEQQPRGPYCGAIGWVNSDRARLAVGIRTFWRRAGSSIVNFGAGSGITWGSDSAAEWDETELKASRLISLASKGAP